MSSIQLRLARKLHASLDRPVVDDRVPETRVPRANYCDPKRHELELRHVFNRHPVIVAHASELSQPGQCLAFDHTGVPVIVVRDREGMLRGFLNACRHRATRLVGEEQVCTRKAFVCPYHNWTYSLEGRLLSIPHPEAFATLPEQRRNLVNVPVAERHGFVWLLAQPSSNEGAQLDLAAHLGELDDELASLSMADHVVFETRTCERATNWKLVIDLFLEGYHIRTLHRDSVYPFFEDARGQFERKGNNSCAVSARRAMREAEPGTVTLENLRRLVTPTYFLFPNAIAIAHPDFISVLRVFPLAPDRIRWVNTFLIPEAPKTDRELEHWRRSLELIENQVFQREDLRIAEEMQRGLAAGADEDLLLGKLEQAVGWFHQSVDACLGV